MRDILAEIVEKKRDLVAEAKRRLPFAELKERAKERSGGLSMAKRFHACDWNLIAEFKLQSPAKGRLCCTHSVEELARIYAANGASMLSVHTDPHFLGANEDLVRVRSLVDLPLLRKDFIIDEYQIVEAQTLGADAVLLIARILSPAQLQEYVFRAWEMGLDALVEVHDEADMEAALATPAEFIGINNRNLQTFTTSIENTLELLPLVDEKRMVIGESGIFSVEDARRLQEAGCGGILVGEGLVRADDVAEMTRRLAAPGALAKESA